MTFKTNEILSKFLTEPAVQKLTKTELNWLRDHCQFTVPFETLAQAKKAMKHFKNKGYAKTFLWDRDNIHPFERHSSCPFLTVYNRAEECNKIEKISIKLGSNVCSAYHYFAKAVHPLNCGLKPVDILDCWKPIVEESFMIMGVNYGGYRLYSQKDFLTYITKSGEDEKDFPLLAFWQYANADELKVSAELAINSDFEDIVAFPKPELEFGKLDGSLLLIKVSKNKLDMLKSILAPSKPTNFFLGQYKNDGYMSSYAFLKRACFIANGYPY